MCYNIQTTSGQFLAKLYKLCLNRSLTPLIKCLCILILSGFSVGAFSQGIKGTVTDEKKQPIPFATIYIENLKTGSSTNINGLFEVNLTAGTYSILFRSLGYKQVKKEVTVGRTMISLEIVMETESYQINEVTISAKSEDPAYAIMRRVIAWAPYHLNQMKYYESEVYLKGTMIADRIPKIMSKHMTLVENNDKGEKKEVKLKTGDIFIDESVNEIVFDAPNKYKQKVKSLRTTFPFGGNVPIAPVDFIKTSLYSPEILDLISPISPRAFSHYRFSYEGCSNEGDYLVDKIKVIPRRESQKLFSGYIFIVEQLWCIHSLDLQNEQFWGNINIKQIYSPVMENAWLPVSHGFRFNASMMGVKGRYNYNATVKYINLQINNRLKGPVVAKAYNKPNDDIEDNSETAKLLAKKEFTKRDLRKVITEARKEQKKAKRDTLKSLEIKEKKEPSVKLDVDSMATKRDTSYWNTMRPIPLTVDEIKSFHKRDSVVLHSKPAEKKDTTQKKHKKWLPAPVRDALMGKSWYVKPLHTNIVYGGLIAPKHLSFNTVDGWVYGQSLNFNTLFDSIHNFSFVPVVKYAFNRQVFMPSFTVKFTHSPFRNGELFINGGRTSSDYNTTLGINTHINSFTSLFFRKNYMKLFENKYLTLGNNIDLANGLRLSLEATYMQANTLENNTDYSFIYTKQREYTPNVPAHTTFQLPQPGMQKSFYTSASISFTPEYFYKIQNRRKIMLSSRFPTFTVGVRSAIKGVLESTSSYKLLWGGITQQKAFGNGNNLQYSVEGGRFFDVKSIHFSEFKHFNTQPLLVQFSGFEKSFQLLDFYWHSTANHYIEGHVHLKSDLLFLKRLPLISNRIWTENIYINYLKAERLNNYLELGYGLGQISGFGNISVFGSFENGNYQRIGMRIGITF